MEIYEIHLGFSETTMGFFREIVNEKIINFFFFILKNAAEQQSYFPLSFG